MDIELLVRVISLLLSKPLPNNRKRQSRQRFKPGSSSVWIRTGYGVVLETILASQMSVNSRIFCKAARDQFSNHTYFPSSAYSRARHYQDVYLSGKRCHHKIYTNYIHDSSVWSETICESWRRQHTIKWFPHLAILSRKQSPTGLPNLQVSDLVHVLGPGKGGRMGSGKQA